MILVVGATGSVGSHVLRDLCRAGRPARGLARSPERADDLRGLDVEVAVGDLDDPPSLRAAVCGVRAVFLATPFGPRQTARECGLLEQARAAGVQRVVKLAALGVDDPAADDAVARSHRGVLSRLAESGLDFAVLAPNSFYQNLLADSADIGAGVLRRPAGDAAVSHIDARDVAAVAVALLSSEGAAAADGGWGGHVHRLTGPAALRWSEVAELAGKVGGHPVRYEPMEPSAYRDALVRRGAPQAVADGLLDLHRRYASGSAAEVTGEVAGLTGTAPRPLAGFLADYRPAFGPG